MILWEKSDCSPDWTELLSILADLAKLTEKCSKNCGLLPKLKTCGVSIGKTCSLFFWPSTDTRDKRRQSHLLEWDAVLKAHPSHLH